MSPAACSSPRGAILFAVSGDLPFGTLASPGAGMMPKLVLGLMIAFGALLVAARGRKPAACRKCPGAISSTPRRSSRRRPSAIALYTMLGFVLTMALLLFVLIYVVERRPSGARWPSASA